MTTTITPDHLVLDVAPRAPGEPAPDLTDYRLVHRAMTVDFDRLATAAAQLVERPDPKRSALLRHYLERVVGEVHSHHQVEDDDVWPMLRAVARDRPDLGGLTEDHQRLDPLLEHAVGLARAEGGGEELVAVLRETADLLAGHIADEEREIFPLFEERLRLEDYEQLQRRFQANLDVRLLPFIVPWAISHASPEERATVLASAPRLMHVMLVLFERRFRTRQQRLFGPSDRSTLSKLDRRRIRLMRVIGTTHTWLLRRTAGRVGSRWLGGSEVVMLTVRGRRSGTPHSVPLMCLHDGDDLLVAASQGGVDREPQWWLNLQADPRAEATLRGERFAVTAERVGDDERPQLWARFVATWPGFEGYQAQVRRQIAVVRLGRTGGAPPVS
ncbi:MAG TPA: nitroreductase/quinone reductase family protein [Aquihabitans sp.]|jgi:deazaflavin-dependent oxidoreductase (nitroreductase family)|nr:nitroreductase/quinone reductase family protein [Aquihabitans sp.]